MDLAALIPEHVLRAALPVVGLRGEEGLHDSIAAALNPPSEPKRFRVVGLRPDGGLTKSPNLSGAGFLPSKEQLSADAKRPAVVAVLVTPASPLTEDSVVAMFDFLK